MLYYAISQKLEQLYSYCRTSICNNNSSFVSCTVHFDDIILNSAYYYNITILHQYLCRICAYRRRHKHPDHSCRLDSKINNSITHELKLCHCGVMKYITSFICVPTCTYTYRFFVYKHFQQIFYDVNIDMSHEFHPVRNNNYYHKRVYLSMTYTSDLPFHIRILQKLLRCHIIIYY